MKLKITKIARFTSKKDGTALLTKDGKPYTSVRIQAQEYGQSWISGFGNAENAHWKEGDEVEANVEKKGEYLNFSLPKKEDQLKEVRLALSSLKTDVATLIRLTSKIADKLDVDEGVEADVDPRDLPDY